MKNNNKAFAIKVGYSFLVAFIFIVFFTSCKRNNPKKLLPDISDKENTTEYKSAIEGITNKELTNKEMTEILKTDYEMNGLLDHKVFVNGKIFQINFYFDENTDMDSIKKARGFAELHIDEKEMTFNNEPIIYDNISGKDLYEYLYTKIYYESRLIYQKNLNPKVGGEYKRPATYFEDANTYLPFREVTENEVLNIFGEGLIEGANVSKITFERSINHHVLIMNIQTKSVYGNKSITQLKRGIDQLLIEELYTPEGYQLYSGILIRLRFSNKVYHEEYYVHTSKEHRWYDVDKGDWMNHQYIYYD